MSNTRDNGPELDYYELRRRHEQYKSRARRSAQPTEAAKPAEAARPIEPKPAAPAEAAKRPAEPSGAFKAPREEDRAPAAADFTPEEDFDEAIENGEEIFVGDEAEAPEEEYENPNPFDSFIRFFHGVKDNISARRNAKNGGEDGDWDGPDALDEDAEPADEAPAKRVFGRKRPEPDFDEAEFDDLGGEAEDIDSVEVDGQPLRPAPARDGAEFNDEEFDDEEFEEEAPKGGFRKFLSLFVTRVDEEDEEAEDEDEDEAAFDFDGEDAPDLSAIPTAYSKPVWQNPRDIEGGQVEMDEMNKPTIDALQEQMAAELETSGMSRRERRERAMRLAAEEAAKAAAAAPAPEVAPVSQSAPAQEAVPSVFEEKPAAPEVREEIVEEPTREFKPVSMRDVAPTTDEKLFDLDEDEEEEEEEEVKKPRRGLFGRKKSRKYDDDEDDDEDDYDDEDEDDEDDEEDDRPARRGLFGRRKRVADEDEDDYDEDDEDDYDDDEDEDDEDDYDDDAYDEYDDDDEDEDDEDDEDEYDEDEDEHRSFGHHVIGVLKSILGIIIFLLVVVIVLNFVPAFNGVVDTLNDKFGDSKAFHFMFPGYIARQTLETYQEPEVTAEPTIEPIDVTDVSATSVLPDLSQDAADGQTASAEGASTDAAATIG